MTPQHHHHPPPPQHPWLIITSVWARNTWGDHRCEEDAARLPGRVSAVPFPAAAVDQPHHGRGRLQETAEGRLPQTLLLQARPAAERQRLRPPLKTMLLSLLSHNTHLLSNFFGAFFMAFPAQMRRKEIKKKPSSIFIPLATRNNTQAQWKVQGSDPFYLECNND